MTKNTDKATQHSALPWQYLEWPHSNVTQPNEDWHCGNIHRGNDVVAVAWGETSEQMDANARLIVVSVNHAEKLAEALRAAQAYLITRPAVSERIRKALAAYEETK